MLINKYFTVFRTAARGMEAQRIALGTASENIANASTTRTEDGTPYDIRRTVQASENDQFARFSNVMSRMKTRVETSNARHISENSLRRRLPDAELGPTTEVVELEQLRAEFDPGHPHADENGYVYYPDVNMVEEMTRMISANRIYEANLSSVQAAKEMIKRTLEI
ncbi:MAG: flagellar basal body rod protein FlgC [Bacteroidota bacterium]